MKRSKINAIMRAAEVFMREKGFHLPPFAYWTPETWRQQDASIHEIVEHKLGWDITDFGLGDFNKSGLLLFTLRNGSPENLKTMEGKLYAEKIMVVEVDQVTPMHFHWSKMEDIINRGGGILKIQLYNATPEEDLDKDTEVEISINSIRHTFEPGTVVELHPGESIALPQRCYHKFWGADERVLVGEVSLVNDDDEDNRFYNPLGRFPKIEEDEPPLYLLCTDYDKYVRF
jgi:hypothetical protein